MTDTTFAADGSALAVRLAGLRKTFGGVVAVDSVDLDIAPGEIVALLGPNGAGKSTTVDMMLGLTRPDAGSATLFGRAPRQAVDAGLVGAMLQSGTLLEDATVREVVALFASVHHAPMPVDEVLERAGIADLARRQATELSGGQTQRVRFALALVPDPDLTVLDEPTVAMDVAARRAFWATMRDLAAVGRTVVFATHYLEEADEFADRIVLMRQGAIVADGSPRHIKAIVAVRTIRAVVPDVAALPPSLFGQADVRVEGHTLEIRTHDIEVAGADLEEAFVALTHQEQP